MIVEVPWRIHRIREEQRRVGRRAGSIYGEANQGADLHRSAAAIERAFPWVADPRLEVPVFSERAYLELEAARATTACGASDEVFARLFKVLDQMLATSGETPIVFLIIPDEFQVEDGLWDEVALAAGRSLGRDRPQRVIGEWLRSRGVLYCDHLPTMRAVPPGPDGSKRLFHLRDTHFNARGNGIAGEAIAELLVSEFANSK